MNSKQIIGLIMAKTGETVPSHAAKSGYTPQAWYDAIKGRTKTPELRQAISMLAATPEDELWPENAKEAA